MSWTDERVERLKKLWADGLSASQIASDLGGVTRNAVIGKVHRLGLSGRAKPVRAAVTRPRKARTARPQQRSGEASFITFGNTALKVELLPETEEEPDYEPVVIEAFEAPVEQRKTILELTETTCKWPVGDPTQEDFYFCGCSSQLGVPYCEHHARVAYQPVQDRRRERRAAAKIASMR